MHDRTYALAIAVILAICCLGMYVAISGYFNSHPLPLVSGSTPIPAPTLVIVLSTDTPTAAKPGATAPRSPTSAPIPSPLGAFQTITASVAGTTPAAKESPVPKVTVPPGLPPAAVVPTPASSTCTMPFCPQGGPGDTTLGPGGIACPRNYIIGLVVGLDGRGLPGRSVHYNGPSGESENAITKQPPDPPGSFNVPTGQPGSTYTLWLLDASGNAVSPQVQVKTQAYAGAGNCPNRIDFIQKR